jgi:hypothetical protein
MDKKNKDILGKHIISLIEKHNPHYFISIQYNHKDEDGNIDKERIKCLYDENLVEKTHSHISNLLREAFENGQPLVSATVGKELLKVAQDVTSRRVRDLDDLIDDPTAFGQLVSDTEWKILSADELTE